MMMEEARTQPSLVRLIYGKKEDAGINVKNN